VGMEKVAKMVEKYKKKDTMKKIITALMIAATFNAVIADDLESSRAKDGEHGSFGHGQDGGYGGHGERGEHGHDGGHGGNGGGSDWGNGGNGGNGGDVD
jgi:hypothetical protein